MSDTVGLRAPPLAEFQDAEPVLPHGFPVA
jgi:hypothetical protein